MKRILVVLGLMIWWTAPAGADWQYTKWGMTVDEVISAAGGSASRPQVADEFPDNDLHHLLSASYSANEFAFEAKFIFDSRERLEEVRLALVDAVKCRQLRGSLSNVYGPPRIVTTSIMEIAKWWDSDNQNVVSLLNLAEATCEIIYQPFRKANTSNGL